MPSLPANLLNKSITDALEESGAVANIITGISRNPRQVLVQNGQNVFELWVYIWTLTHGGGQFRPPDEYRVQLTGVTPPLNLNPNGPTILIGYKPDLGCFAGFDVDRHRRFSTHSPSIQIPITSLYSALQHGFGFATKGNNEVAVGFRSDQFLAYVLNSDLLHEYGGEAKMADLLTKAASLQPISDHDLGKIAKKRQRVVTTISHLSRDSNFETKVKNAYSHRCAVTRMQLKLIDAAHILPVGAEGSDDEVHNGICLSPTYHRAFDRSLIYLDEQLFMRINSSKKQELTQLSLDGGITDFEICLNRKIHLPADPNQQPLLDLIQEANKFRKIP